MKNIPQRTCMGCNIKKDKKDLIRIVRIPNIEDTSNSIIIDNTGKQEGRGAYICNSEQCLEKAIKSKRIERVLNIKISEEVYNNLKKIISGGEFIG